jgi:hypothetical protein
MVQGDVYLTGKTTPDGYLVKSSELVVVNQGVAMRLTYPKEMIPSVETVTLDDPRLTNVWGGTLRRISLTGVSTAPCKGKYVFKISEL